MDSRLGILEQKNKTRRKTEDKHEEKQIGIQNKRTGYNNCGK